MKPSQALGPASNVVVSKMPGVVPHRHQQNESLYACRRPSSWVLDGPATHCVIFPCTCHAMQALQEGGLSRAGLLSCPKRGGGGLVVKSINAWVEVPQLGGFDQGISWYRKPGPVAGTGARAGTGHPRMGYLLRSTRSTWDDPLTNLWAGVSKTTRNGQQAHTRVPAAPCCPCTKGSVVPSPEQGLDGLGAMRFRGPGSYCSFAVMCVKLRLVFSSLWWQSV